MERKKAGAKVKSTVKAGGIQVQHNRPVKGLKVKSTVKAGGISLQHNRRLSA